ncbi:Uncharacterised protein [Mycobacterium tuberculosis]|nr:Uncharacterised protein [Mycobacterium tuberculosis]
MVENIVRLAFAGIFVAVLDQQPVGALAAVAVMLHSHQYPLAMELAAFQREFEVSFFETAFRIVR